MVGFALGAIVYVDTWCKEQGRVWLRGNKRGRGGFAKKEFRYYLGSAGKKNKNTANVKEYK